MRVFKKDNVERRVSTDAAAEKLISKGYEEVAGQSNPGNGEGAETRSIDKMKLDELKALAESKGIEGYESLTRKELAAVLKDVV